MCTSYKHTAGWIYSRTHKYGLHTHRHTNTPARVSVRILLQIAWRTVITQTKGRDHHAETGTGGTEKMYTYVCIYMYMFYYKNTVRRVCVWSSNVSGFVVAARLRATSLRSNVSPHAIRHECMCALAITCAQYHNDSHTHTHAQHRHAHTPPAKMCAHVYK